MVINDSCSIIQKIKQTVKKSSSFKMCHTLLQHYVHCSHTNVSFITCENFDWYPSYHNDGLEINERHHGDLKGIAHSYERKCLACVKSEWVANGPSWVSMMVDPECLDPGFDEPPEADESNVGLGLAGDVVDLQEVRMIVERHTPHSPDRDLPGVNLQQARFEAFYGQLGIIVPRNLLAEIQAICVLNHIKVAESIRFYPGFQDWTFAKVDKIVASHILLNNLPRLTLHLPSGRSETYQAFSSVSVFLVLHVVLDPHGSGKVVQDLVTGIFFRHDMRRRAAAGDQQSSSLQHDFEVFRWLVIYLSEHAGAYDLFASSLSREALEATGSVLDIMNAAGTGYQNIVRRGISNISHAADLQIASRKPWAYLWNRRIDPRYLTNGKTGQTPSPIERPETNIEGAEPRLTSNDPTHGSGYLRNTPLVDLLKSIHHIPSPAPILSETAATAVRTRKVTFHFSGCGHYNTVAVSTLARVNSDIRSTGCRCRHFVETLLTERTALSRTKCLCCRWEQTQLQDLEDDDDIRNFKDWCFSRQIHSVEPTRAIQ